MTKRKTEGRMEEEEAVGPYNEEVDYERSENEQSQENNIPDEIEIQVPLLRSEVTAPGRKKAVKSILKNRPKKKTVIARRFNKLVSTVETLVNRREEEQAVNVVTERRPTLEPILSRDDLRNRLNQTRQEKRKHRPAKGSTNEKFGGDRRQERIVDDGRQERSQTSRHVSTSSAPSIHSRHNDSRTEERSNIKYRRKESKSDSTTHSALSKSERKELHQRRREREEMEKQEIALLARIEIQQVREKEKLLEEGRQTLRKELMKKKEKEAGGREEENIRKLSKRHYPSPVKSHKSDKRQTLNQKKWKEVLEEKNGEENLLRCHHKEDGRDRSLTEDELREIYRKRDEEEMMKKGYGGSWQAPPNNG